ncbi:prephenate dehydratase domain-containing protein [Candidatus Carsonella ruddii]|uniref:prephenate dehydratase domain-containing protein n=1 Tax=Carsonella ruddii TaxID=114186 RepID=UPI003D524EB8
MFKKFLKTKYFFFLLNSINNFKKKFFLILGPIGNYSYNILIKKIKKKFNFFSLNSIKLLKFNRNKIIPYENNNGGVVRDTIELLLNKKIFINNIMIINIKHNFFIYNKKKKIYLHKQSYKQINKKISFFKNIKKKIINSNSNFNYGINICNNVSKKIFLINIKNINLKDNIINKTKFIINNNKKYKKKIISFFINKYFFFEKILTIYKKKIFYYEIFFKSLKYFLFKMKLLKNKITILLVGFYNII